MAKYVLKAGNYELNGKRYVVDKDIDLSDDKEKSLAEATAIIQDKITTENKGKENFKKIDKLSNMIKRRKTLEEKTGKTFDEILSGVFESASKAEKNAKKNSDEISKAKEEISQETKNEKNNEISEDLKKLGNTLKQQVINNNKNNQELKTQVDKINKHIIQSKSQNKEVIPKVNLHQNKLNASKLKNKKENSTHALENYCKKISDIITNEIKEQERTANEINKHSELHKETIKPRRHLATIKIPKTLDESDSKWESKIKELNSFIASQYVGNSKYQEKNKKRIHGKMKEMNINAKDRDDIYDKLMTKFDLEYASDEIYKNIKKEADALSMDIVDYASSNNISEENKKKLVETRKQIQSQANEEYNKRLEKRLSEFKNVKFALPPGTKVSASKDKPRILSEPIFFKSREDIYEFLMKTYNSKSKKSYAEKLEDIKKSFDDSQIYNYKEKDDIDYFNRKFIGKKFSSEKYSNNVYNMPNTYYENKGNKGAINPVIGTGFEETLYNKTYDYAVYSKYGINPNTSVEDMTKYTKHGTLLDRDIKKNSQEVREMKINTTNMQVEAEQGNIKYNSDSDEKHRAVSEREERKREAANIVNEKLERLEEVNPHSKITRDTEPEKTQNSTIDFRETFNSKEIDLSEINEQALEAQKTLLEDIVALNSQINNIQEAGVNAKKEYLEQYSSEKSSDEEKARAKEKIEMIEEEVNNKLNPLKNAKAKKQQELEINKRVIREIIEKVLSEQGVDIKKIRKLQALQENGGKIGGSSPTRQTLISQDGQMFFGFGNDDGGSRKGLKLITEYSQALQNLIMDISLAKASLSLLSGAFTWVVMAGYEVEKTIFDLGVVGQKSLNEIRSLRSEFLNMASTSRYSAIELAKSASEIIRVGRSYDEAKQILASSERLATASFEDLGKATNSVIKAMTAFNLSAESASHVANTFHNIANTTPLSLQTFDESLRQTAAAFGAIVYFSSKSGTELEEYKKQVLDTTAVLTGLQSILGRTGAQAGTTLKQFATKLIAPQPEASAKMNAEFRQKGIDYSSAQLSADIKNNLDEGLNKLAELYKMGALSYDTLSKMVGTRHVSQIASMLEMINKAGGLAGAKDMYVYSTSLVDDAIKAQASWANEWDKLMHSIDMAKGVLMSFVDGPGTIFIKFLSGLLKSLTALDSSLGHVGSTTTVGTIGMFGLMKAGKSIYKTVHAGDEIRKMMTSLGKDQAKALELIQTMSKINAGDSPNKIKEIIGLLSDYQEGATQAAKATMTFNEALRSTNKIQNIGKVLGGSIKNFILANKWILLITTAISAGLYIWKKTEQTLVELGEQAKDSGKNLRTYQQLALEMSSQDKLTDTILNQASAFNKLKGSISEAQYALTDILDKLADIKPVKQLLSEKVDKNGFSDLKQEAVLSVLTKKDENAMRAFDKAYKKEMDEWKSNPINQKLMKDQFKKRYSQNADVKLDEIIRENVVKERKIDINKIAKTKGDIEDLEFLNLWAESAYARRMGNRIFKGTKEENEKYREEFLKKRELAFEIGGYKFDRAKKTYTLENGTIIDLLDDKSVIKNVKELNDTNALSNQIKQQEIELVRNSIDSMKNLNSALNTYAEYFRNLVSKKIEASLPTFSRISLKENLEQDNIYSNYAKQYIDTSAKAMRDYGINPEDIQIGNNEILKSIGELRASIDKRDKLVKEVIDDVNKKMSSDNNELNGALSILKTKGINTNEEMIGFFKNIMAPDEKMQEIVSEMNNFRNSMNNNIESVDNLELWKKLINSNDTIPVLLNTRDEAVLEKYKEIEEKYKEKFKESINDVNEFTSRIEEKLIKNGIEFTDILNYIDNDTKNISERDLETIKGVITNKDKALIKDIYNKIDLEKNDMLLTYYNEKFSYIQEKIAEELLKNDPSIDKETLQKISTDLANVFIRNLGLQLQSFYKVGEIDKTIRYQQEDILRRNQKSINDTLIEQIDMSAKYKKLMNERIYNLRKYEKYLKDGGTDTELGMIIDDTEKLISNFKIDLGAKAEQLSSYQKLATDPTQNTIELNKKIFDIQASMLDSTSQAIENLYAQKNKIISQVEKIFKDIEFNNDISSNMRSLIFDRVKAVYSGIADDFADIRQNMYKQAEIYEKQALLEEKHKRMSDVLTGEDKNKELYEYAKEYNQNVGELFKLQNELITKQKAILENNISSALDNISKRARGEDIKIDVQGAQSTLAKALSSLVFKNEVKSPEMLMVKGQETEIEILKKSKEHLAGLENTLNDLLNIYKHIKLQEVDITPGRYGILSSQNKKGELFNSLNENDKEIVNKAADNIRKKYLLSDRSATNNDLIAYKLQNNIRETTDKDGRFGYIMVNENKEDYHKNVKFSTILDDLSKYGIAENGDYTLNSNGDVFYKNRQFIGSTIKKDNGGLSFREESDIYYDKGKLIEAMPSFFQDEYQSFFTHNMNGQFMTKEELALEGIKLMTEAKNKAENKEQYLSTIKTRDDKEAKYSNSISKLLSLIQGLSAISVIMQDLKNADFEKKLEEIKKEFSDQKLELQRQTALSTTNADKFSKEVEMWNLEARQQAEIDTMTEENRIENNLVAINQAIIKNSSDMIQQLASINQNTNPENLVNNLKAMSGIGGNAKGASVVQDAYGFISVIDNNGNKETLIDKFTSSKGKIPTKRTSSDSNTRPENKNSGGSFLGFLGDLIFGGLQGTNINFDKNIYDSALSKINSNSPISTQEYQQLQYVLSNGGTLTSMGSIGDYSQSLMSIFSGIQNSSTGELGLGLSNLGKSIGGEQTMAVITKFLAKQGVKDLLGSEGFKKISESAIGKKLGLKGIKDALTPGSNGTSLIGNSLAYIGGGLSSIGGGFQLGQMIGTGKFDLGGTIGAGLSLASGAQALAGTTLAGNLGVTLGAAKGSALAGAVGGAALAGAVALPAIAIGAYASKQLGRRAKAKAKLKQNDILREKEAEQYQKMLEALNAQKNITLGNMTQQNTAVGYDEAMRRALMSTPLTASSSELFKDYQVSYRGGKFGQGRKRKKWVYSAVDATVGIQDFGYNTISDLSDSYGLLNNITSKMQELDRLMSTRGRDSGNREQRKEWAQWYATKEASQMLFDQIKDMQESMVKSLSTLTQAYFGFETVGLNSKGGIAQEGETIDRYTTGAWQERTNMLNTFVQDFLKAGNTVGENIAKIFVEGASNAFVKNHTQLNKLMNKLEKNFENLANSFVNTDDLIEAAEYELTSGKNSEEVYQSIFDQLKTAGYGTQEQYDKAQQALKNDNYKEFVEIMKQMVANGNSSYTQIQELIKNLDSLEKIQEDLEKGMRDFVDKWVDGGGKLSDIIASMDNLLSRSADLISDVLLNGNASDGLENFKSIINDKILPQIKDIMIDSMQQDIFGFESMMKNFQDKLLNGKLTFSGVDGVDNFVSDIGTFMDILSDPTGNIDHIMNSMGGEALQKLLAYKNLMDEINEELYERMSLEEKVAYNQEKLNQEASKYKTELSKHGFINIGDLGETSFKELEHQLQDLLAVPVEQRNAQWEKSYDELRKKIELAKNQYGTLNDTINKLEEDMFKQDMANQQFSQLWLDGIIKGDYSTIRDQLSEETQGLMDSVMESLSASEWEQGATSIGQNMASNIIQAYTNKLISSGELKQASGLLNEMMFDNINFVNSNGLFNFDMLYQLSQQSAKLAVENEANRQRLEAINGMFDYTKDIRYSSLEKDINYKTSSTKESIYNITNNNNFNVSGLISSSGDMTMMANALAPYIIEAMRNYGY